MELPGIVPLQHLEASALCSIAKKAQLPLLHDHPEILPNTSGSLTRPARFCRSLSQKPEATPRKEAITSHTSGWPCAYKPRSSILPPAGTFYPCLAYAQIVAKLPTDRAWCRVSLQKDSIWCHSEGSPVGTGLQQPAKWHETCSLAVPMCQLSLTIQAHVRAAHPGWQPRQL